MNEFNGKTIGQLTGEERKKAISQLIESSGWTGTATHRFRAECEADVVRFIEAIMHGSVAVDGFAFEQVNGDSWDGVMIFGADPAVEQRQVDLWNPKFLYNLSDDEIKEAIRLGMDARFYFYLWEIYTGWGCEFEIETDLTLDAIRKFMKKVDDGHVMVESLNFADEYTGERWYLEGESR